MELLEILVSSLKMLLCTLKVGRVIGSFDSFNPHYVTNMGKQEPKKKRRRREGDG